MSNTDRTGMFLNFTDQELAHNIAHKLKPLLREIVDDIKHQDTEDDESPMSMSEASDWLNLSRTTFSKIVNKGEIPFKSLNPDHPKAKKFFTKKDLREWLLKNRNRTIEELKNASYGKKESRN